MGVAAIPTKYNGIQFRSRLEARWAAFFDQLGIVWSYEPTDMSGWIPDFRIGDALIEIKPVREYPREAGQKIIKAIGEWSQLECLILGESPTPHELLPFVLQLGWDLRIGEAILVPVLIRNDRGQSTVKWEIAKINDWSAADYEKTLLKVIAVERLERNRPDIQFDDIAVGASGIAMAKWAEASNATQWKSPGGSGQ